MKKIFKKVISLALTIITSMSLIVIPNSKSNQFQANAAYITYDSYEKALKGTLIGSSYQKIISSKVIDEAPFRSNIEYMIKAKRGDLMIPQYNSMDCTLICIENLLLYYKKIMENSTSSALSRGIMYLKLKQIASEKYYYSDKKGLSAIYHKSMCKSAFEAFGMKNVNINTFSRPTGCHTLEQLLRDEPYILSSTDEYHSILVFDWRKYEVKVKGYDGRIYTKYASFIRAHDPNGEIIVLPASCVNSNSYDWEQVMYVKSCKLK